MKKILIAALCLGLFASTAEARTRRAVAPVAAPNTVSCVVMPFPGNGCPLLGRMIGAGLWGTAIGLTAGAGLALVPVAHAVAYGTIVGASVGVASPVLSQY
jgi:hypothetical protein